MLFNPVLESGMLICPMFQCNPYRVESMSLNKNKKSVSNVHNLCWFVIILINAGHVSLWKDMCILKPCQSEPLLATEKEELK